jgi:hypothetical protein
MKPRAKVVSVPFCDELLWGVECNGKWFYWCYVDKASAESIAKTTDTESKIQMNITYDRPYKLSLFTSK